MKEKNKRNLLIMMSLLIISFIVIGVSYAIWQMTLTQTDKNTVTTSCFKIEFQDANPLNLEKSYPILNEEGKNLIPYTFTIKNTCDTYATYQINLEVLNTSTLINLDTIRVLLNETNFEKDSSLLESYEQVEKTLANATTSYKLETGYLNKEETKTFELRLWLDESTPPDEAYMNKVLESKVTIITSYLNESPSYAEVITNCSNNGYKTTICMLENSSYDTTNLAYDETIDNNLRYIGASPDNYIDIGDRDASGNIIPWRIIGVMNNVGDGNGNSETRLKIIRSESIGGYSWDTSASSINGGYGVNEWSQSDMMKLLNPGFESESIGGSLYWNRSSGNCYNGSNNANTACDFTSSGLSNDAKSHIGEALWHTGSNGNEATYSNILTSKFYELEKSNNTGKICPSDEYCNDNVERTTSWMGLVGLMSPADYGYATSGGNNTNRETCLNTKLYNWDGTGVVECKNNDWLYNSNNTQWTITPSAYATGAHPVFNVYQTGYVPEYYSASDAFHARPTVFLKADTKIVSGTGSSIDPYKLAI